jgi:hypothetical protein
MLQEDILICLNYVWKIHQALVTEYNALLQAEPKSIKRQNLIFATTARERPSLLTLFSP